MVCEFKPCVRLHAGSEEPAWHSLSLPLSLPLPHSHSLSLKINKLLKQLLGTFKEMFDGI